MAVTGGDAMTRISAPWRDPAKRAFLLQGLVVVVLGAFVLWIANNAVSNLARLDIASGYGFLDQRAGFGVPTSLIAYSPEATYLRAFAVGILNTLLVSALGIVAATLIGFVVGVARLSSNWLIRTIATAYVEGLRNIPLLLQIFFWYFAVLGALPQPRRAFSIADTVFLSNRGLFLPAPMPQDLFWVTPVVLGLSAVACLLYSRWTRGRREREGRFDWLGWIPFTIVAVPTLVSWLITGAPLEWSMPHLQGFRFAGGLSIVPELVALWFALSIYTGTFIAEAVRGGILAVDKGQTDAARALGLTRGQTLRLVVIPQALRVIVPPLTNQYLSLTKNSSLGAAIGFPELMNVSGTVLNQTGQAVEVLALTMAVYGTICLVIAASMNAVNRAVHIEER